MNAEMHARRFERERRARKEAERLLESKSRDLYLTNQELQSLTESLERQVAERTEDLAHARDEALAASRAKSRFLAIMSHEIRSPLNAVIGALGLLRDTRLDEEQRRFVDISRGCAESLLAIANDILDYSKIEANKLGIEAESFDVRGLVADVAASFDARCRDKSIALAVEVDESVPGIFIADGARVRQVLINLVDNALKFTEKGEIKVSLGLAPPGDDGVELAFRVKDTGLGISEENQVRLFEEFWSWAPNSPERIMGTGLGLAISSRLVAMMGGEMGVDSVLGRGSTFWFNLPSKTAREGTASGAIPPRETMDSTRSLSGRVLLAEDDRANQMISRAMLTKSGLSVDVVGNGREALEAVRSQAYNVVLMDIDMPEMDGLEATRRIRALSGDGARTPVIAMTAHAMRGDREKFLAEGLDDYIVKPINRERLVHCLARWLEPESAGP